MVQGIQKNMIYPNIKTAQSHKENHKNPFQALFLKSEAHHMYPNKFHPNTEHHWVLLYKENRNIVYSCRFLFLKEKHSHQHNCYPNK